MLNLRRSTANERLTLTQISVQSADLFRGTQGTCQETIGVKLLQPLAIQNIAFASGHILHVSGIYQQHLETALLEKLEDGNPINSRRLHHHRLNTHAN